MLLDRLEFQHLRLYIEKINYDYTNNTGIDKHNNNKPCTFEQDNNNNNKKLRKCPNQRSHVISDYSPVCIFHLF